jgi:hypothetical protein
MNDNWIKDGETIRANYYGTIVEGVVTESRVKYGGSVQYMVTLNEPVTFRWRKEPVNEVLVHKENLVV